MFLWQHQYMHVCVSLASQAVMQPQVKEQPGHMSQVSVALKW